MIGTFVGIYIELSKTRRIAYLVHLMNSNVDGRNAALDEMISARNATLTHRASELIWV
jgi:hypothetical protein